MKKRFFLFSILLFNFALFSLYAGHQKKVYESNYLLKLEILEMCEKDQELRYQWMDAIGTEAEAELLEKMSELDDMHLARLKEIISLYGWPGFALVGEEGSQAMWLLVQHTSDLEFQKHCLALLEEAVAKRDADIINWAYLTDRVLMYEGKKQIYGTQLLFVNNTLTIYPIEDEEHVDERRLAIGMCPIEEYLELIQQIYTTAQQSQKN